VGRRQIRQGGANERNRHLIPCPKSEAVTQDTIQPVGRPPVDEPDAHGQAALLLTESLLHMLVASRRLTNAQAVDVVHSAAVVKVEVAEAAGESANRMLESLALLNRMEDSFRADEPFGSI
jgi:hypothetical protein